VGIWVMHRYEYGRANAAIEVTRAIREFTTLGELEVRLYAEGRVYESFTFDTQEDGDRFYQTIVSAIKANHALIDLDEMGVVWRDSSFYDDSLPVEIIGVECDNPLNVTIVEDLTVS